MIEVKQSRAAASTIVEVAKFLVNAYRTEKRREIEYPELEAMLFYVWFKVLGEEHYELFHADWKRSYSRMMFNDECVEQEIRAVLGGNEEAELCRDVQNALSFYCYSGLFDCKIFKTLYWLIDDLNDLDFKNLSVVTADGYLSAVKEKHSQKRGFMSWFKRGKAAE